MRADEQHAAPPVPQAGVGVEQVGGAVQRDHGLARARAAVDHQRATGSRADDGVLVGRDRAEHVPHPGRPAGAQAGDEGRLVVQRGVVSFEPVRGEHLVPVVADPAPGPAVAAAAGQAHRVGVGRAEERFGRGGTPVQQQPAALAVGQAESSDVGRLAIVGADHVAQAQVQAEPAQHPQATGQPVDLLVPVQCLLADAAGRPELGFEAPGQIGDRLLQAGRDGGEVLLVVGDQYRVGLGRQPAGQVERAHGRVGHGISSDLPNQRPSASRRAGAAVLAGSSMRAAQAM